ncbi:MAG: aldo/keto reductase [Leptolinea sp.]|jgi:aryl-alcohol dehydrogenase-like predicted oxidoreductase|nr:aldo/keto reductase [Leptolinea sp.]
MEYRYLGSTGLRVSEIGLGSMQFGWTADEETSFSILSKAVDAGINFIDSADIYSRWVKGNPGGVSEQIIGNWMKKTGVPRSDLVIATKVRGAMGPGVNDEGLSRAHIMKAVEDSLRRLQTDYIDLYQTHWFDENTPIEETLSTLTDLVHQGKVRYLGCSNIPAWRLVESLWAADRRHLARYESLQPHYHLLRREEFEKGLADVCRTYSLGVMPYSPLAGGFLTGKYRRDETDTGSQRNVSKYFNERGWKMIDRLESIARVRKKSVSQIALGWLLSQPLITCPIIGPRSLEQLEDNLGAAGLRLNPDEMKALDQESAWQPVES